MASRVAQAYLAACLAELTALKPGNVHTYAAGHNMTVADFEISARASAEAMAAGNSTVGRRILTAIQATRAAVGCNTNLGIILLCAPLAQAAAQSNKSDFHTAVRDVLTGLTIDDASDAFAAIRLANPAGLGDSTSHDVRQTPKISLLAAMKAAADRDRIALQYASGFADVFGLGLERLATGRRRWAEPEWAISSAYLGFLAAFPDSHVERKYGRKAAEAVVAEARHYDALLAHTADPRTILPELLAFDSALKQKDINPGTSADLTVAALFVAELR
jgi:triphosphoribosyl-dephospho-CoA synthase